MQGVDVEIVAPFLVMLVIVPPVMVSCLGEPLFMYVVPLIQLLLAVYAPPANSPPRYGVLPEIGFVIVPTGL